jgi:hypothetical protein
MAGPWEQYQKQPPAEGPWTQYQQAPAVDPYASTGGPGMLAAAPPQGTSAMQLAGNVGAGTNSFISDTLGAPVDLTTWGLNKGGDLINAIFGDGTVGRIENPIGGSQSIRDLEAMIGISPDQVPMPTTADRIARGAGYGLAASMLPAGAAVNAGPMVRAVTGAPTVENAIAGLFSGAGGTAAAEAVPDPYKGWAALLGGLFGGGVATTVGSLGRGVAEGVRGMVQGAVNPADRADDLLVQSIMRDSTSPERMAQSVDDAAKAGNPAFAAIDTGGRNTQRLAGVVARVPGEASDDMTQFAVKRQAGQGDRVSGYVDEALGDGSGAYATEQGLLQSRREAAQPLYEQAYAAPVPSGDVYSSLLTRRSVQDAIPAAERVAAERQMPISELFTSVAGPNGELMRVPTVRGWDFIKRELDSVVDRLYRSGDTTAAGAIKETRDQLKTQLSQDVPAYGQALAQYADDSSALRAMQTGRELATARNADAASAEFGRLNPGEQALARVGASREIGGRVDNMRPSQDKTLGMDTPAFKQKLETLAGAEATDRFGQQISREQQMVRSNRRLTTGSDTFENALGAADAEGVISGVVNNVARGRGLTATALDALGNAVGGVLRRAQGINEDVGRRVADYLMSTDPEEIRALSAAFARAQSPEAVSDEFIRRVMGADLRNSAIGVASPPDEGDPTVNAIMRARNGNDR